MQQVLMQQVLMQQVLMQQVPVPAVRRASMVLVLAKELRPAKELRLVPRLGSHCRRPC